MQKITAISRFVNCQTQEEYAVEKALERRHAKPVRQDLYGHLWELMYMDLSAMPKR